MLYFFFQAEDGIRDATVTGVQTCALPIFRRGPLWPGPGRAGEPRPWGTASRTPPGSSPSGTPWGSGPYGMPNGAKAAPVPRGVIWSTRRRRFGASPAGQGPGDIGVLGGARRAAPGKESAAAGGLRDRSSVTECHAAVLSARKLDTPRAAR